METFHRAAALLATALAALVLAWTPPAAAQRFESGLLWRIERGDAPPSHVFGTIHVSDPRVTRLPPPVSRALDASRSVTVEAVLDPSSMLALAKRMVFLDGRDLPGAVGAELYEKTAALTAAMGLPEQAVRLFRPWAIALVLSAPRQDPREILDFVIASTVRGQGKPVYELESLEEQAELFEGMPDGDQVAMLRRAVESYERMPSAIDRMIGLYLARDLAGMQRLVEEVAGGTADLKRLHETFSRRLLNERNVRMAERMQPRLQEGGAFVAVGALHLYGGSGVLAELERRGWRVTREY